MRKLRNPKLEIFARELAAGKTPEQAGEIADNFSGKLEPRDEFRERLAEMFSQRMKEFFALFVDAKTKTFRAVLERIKAGCSTLDPATATALLFTEECALLKAIAVLPARWITRGEFDALPIHQLFRDDLFYRGGDYVDIAGAPCDEYRAPLGGCWILVNGWFFRPNIDGPSALN